MVCKSRWIFILPITTFACQHVSESEGEPHSTGEPSQQSSSASSMIPSGENTRSSNSSVPSSEPDTETWAESTTSDGADSDTTDEDRETSDTNDTNDSVSFVDRDVEPQPWCDTYSQDCPEGEKCTFVSLSGGSPWRESICAPVVESPKGLAVECSLENATTGVDDCDFDSFCWTPNGDAGPGLCHPFFRGSEEDGSCPDGYAVVGVSQGPLWCLRECDPLAQSCPERQSCIVDYGYGSPFICAYYTSGGDKSYGAPCMFINECNPGLNCTNPEIIPDCDGIACCSPYCDINNPIQCDGLSEMPLDCIPLFEAHDDNEAFHHVGVCGVQEG